MGRFDLIRRNRPARLLTAAVVLATAAPAGAETQLRFSLDDRLDGPSALYLVPQDRGYCRNHGLDVAIDEGASPQEPITRVAGGSHEFGFVDINALIRYRDQHPTAPVKAVFMVYSKPPFAVVTRKSREITAPKH